MNKDIKIGDIVLNVSASPAWGTHPRLTIGKLYKVIDISDHRKLGLDSDKVYLKITTDSGEDGNYDSERFVLANSKLAMYLYS